MMRIIIILFLIIFGCFIFISCKPPKIIYGIEEIAATQQDSLFLVNTSADIYFIRSHTGIVNISIEYFNNNQKEINWIDYKIEIVFEDQTEELTDYTCFYDSTNDSTIVKKIQVKEKNNRTVVTFRTYVQIEKLSNYAYKKNNDYHKLILQFSISKDSIVSSYNISFIPKKIRKFVY